MRRWDYDKGCWEDGKHVAWAEIYRSANSSLGQTYCAPPEPPDSKQDKISTSTSDSPSLLPNTSSGEQDTSRTIFKQPDPSLISESPIGWDWRKDQEGEIMWYSAVPMDANAAKQSTILVDQEDGISLIPVFSAYNEHDPIRLDPNERSILIKKLTKAINILNPSACQDFRSTQDHPRIKASGDRAFLRQALNSLSGKSLMNLGGMRFRQAPPTFDETKCGDHFTDYRDIESKETATLQSLNKVPTAQQLFDYVTTANKKIEVEDSDESDASGETDDME
jgi:hypothetical protein